MDTNKKVNVDALLREALESSEKPNAALVHKLKFNLNEERCVMKNKRTIRPSRIIAAALIAALSITAIAFAAPAVWRQLDTRVIEGEDYISNFGAKVSEDGSESVMSAEFHAGPLEGGLIKVEVDGEYMVLADPISFDNLADAVNISGFDNVFTPAYLPAGFELQRAGFPINPENHPNNPYAATRMMAIYSNGEDSINIQIMQWDSDWGISFFSPSQVDITINGHAGAIADGMIMVIIDDVLYTIISSDITQAELIMIAESLL